MPPPTPGPTLRTIPARTLGRYLASVARLLDRLVGGRAPERLVFAGFSQGAPMAWRAAVRSAHPCHGVIALGGAMPPDVAEDPAVAFPPVLIGRGPRDTWYTEER